MTRPSLPLQRPPRLLRLLAAGAVALAPAAAPAQSAKDIAAAKQAFREGDEAEVRGDLPTALARFQKALSVKDTPQIRLRVGAVEEKLGHLVDALASYEAGLAKASSMPSVAKVAGDQIAALRPRIPTLTLVVRAAPADLAVTVDGAPLLPAALGSALPLDPGQHRVHAVASGRVPLDQIVTLVERDRHFVEIALVPDAVYVPPPPPSKLPGALVVTGGGALVVTGAAIFALSYVKDGQINALCGGAARPTCPESQMSSILGQVSTVNDLRFLGSALGLVGLGGAAFGGYLLAKASRTESGAAVRVFPVTGAGVVGVGASGRF